MADLFYKNTVKGLDEEERELRSSSLPADQKRDLLSQINAQRKQALRDSPEASLAAKQGVADGLKNLSSKGKLTPELLAEARQRASDAGVGEGAFNSFLSKNKINQFSGDPREAQQNVLFSRQFGGGLATQQLMQDPNYKLGSGSSLQQAPERVGTKAGSFRNAARRLRKQGYFGAAQQMAMAGEQTRMSEPTISSDQTRLADMQRRMFASRLMNQNQDLQQQYQDSINKLLTNRGGFSL